MLSISYQLSRSRVAAGQGHDLDLVVRVRAPAPPPGGKRAPVCVLPLVDVSGSMEGDKLRSVRKALRLLATHLQPGDFLGLATFDTTAAVPVHVAELTEERRARFLQGASMLRAGHQTNLAGGLIATALELADRPLPEGVRARVIALTDGQANCGKAIRPHDLCALVKDAFTTTSLSAFGYGSDCDQTLLGDLAEAGGGSFAYVENDDAVLTAFARELGGLLSTCASDLRVRVVPLAGAPTEERLGDVLFHGETATVVRIAAPLRNLGVAIPVATIEATWRDAGGKVQRAEVPVTLDYVQAAEADQHDAPAVSKVRDERVVREAQTQAEEAARRRDFATAARILAEAAARLVDRSLAAFLLEQVAPYYMNAKSYLDGSARRSSVYQGLKGKRVLISDDEVAARLDLGPSEAEREMERKFRAAVQNQEPDPFGPPRGRRPKP